MSDSILTLTELAQEKVRAAQAAEQRSDAALRVTVLEEGAAFKYNLEFVEGGSQGEDDTVVISEEIRIFVDPTSTERLQGSVLDYVDELSGSWFKFDNPNQPALAKDPIAVRVQQVIDDKVNPGVASHGGWVSLVGLDEGRAFLQFGGGCQGCGMIDVTLKQGVEVMIREAVPEIVEVLDTTDHAGGTNPYYQPGK